MKYLIVLFFMINTAYGAQCGVGTRADINKCEVNDLITNFVDYGTCEFAEGEAQEFEFLICDPVVPLSFFEAKLQEWKDSKIAIIVEQERIQDVTDRLNALGVVFGNYGTVSGAREFMIECGYSHPNPAIWIKGIYDLDTTKLVCFESKKTKIDSDKADRDSKKADKDTAKGAIKNYDCSTITEPYSKLLCEAR